MSVVFSTVALVGGTFGYFLGVAAPSATAIPASQRACAFTSITTSSNSAAQAIPGLALSINNGTAARNVVVQFSADMGVDTNAEVRLSYKIDAGAPQEDVYGPANIANNQEFFEARSTIAVIPLGAGVHTITPYWRVSGVAGKNAYADSRCFTAEGRTK